MRLRIDLCRRGHPWDEGNTRWVYPAGRKPMRQCRACARFLQRLRYRKDDAYREAEKQRTRSYYHARIRLRLRPVGASARQQENPHADVR